ncbi:hypothetical protein [Streptomyces roseifaciens]|uniref:hypothetical protein n=1 Tax=Streptomyces roseifaciens TaxID=1488406 RepID=UPI0011875CD7|nr:hypothetical protein [Streptomyces roseifaciens]
MNAATATGLLHLIAAEPTLLASAPADPDESDLHLRVREGRHLCLGCGQPARCAAVVNSDTHGPRWLDLCSPCWQTVRTANVLCGDAEGAGEPGEPGDADGQAGS